MAALPDGDLEEILDLLTHLDTKFRKTQALATAWLTDADLRSKSARRARTTICQSWLAKVEHSWPTLRSDLSLGLAAFESRRILLEGEVPFSFTWHGPTSQQRVLLQDEHFVHLMQEMDSARYVVASLLTEGLNDSCAASGATQMVWVLISAFHQKLSLAYMLTASPNWECLPSLGGRLHWDSHMAYNFVYHEHVTEEIPVSITKELLRGRAQSIENIASVLNCFLEEDASLDADKLSNDKEIKAGEIIKAPFAEVLRTLEDSLASPEAATALCKGPSGKCTELFTMICQCFAQMAYFDFASEYFDNDRATALSLGIFSHSVDAKHLVAGIHALHIWPSETPLPSDDHEFGLFLSTIELVTVPGNGHTQDQADMGTKRRKCTSQFLSEILKGRAALQSVLNSCKQGTADKLFAEMMRLRLRQAALLCTFA